MRISERKAFSKTVSETFQPTFLPLCWTISCRGIEVKTWKIMLALLLISLSLVAILPIGKTLEFVHAATSSTPPPTAWSKTYGGTRPDYALSVNQTSDNGYALAGYTSSFGAGGDDAWLVKTDSSGNIQWKQTYGGTGGDYASSVVKTSDGGYALAG